MARPEAAEPLLGRVLELQPGNAWALFRRALCHMAARDYESAAAELSAARAMAPDEPVLRMDPGLLRECHCRRCPCCTSRHCPCLLLKSCIAGPS